MVIGMGTPNIPIQTRKFREGDCSDHIRVKSVSGGVPVPVAFACISHLKKPEVVTEIASY
jgi:hypothetical protein